jgi:ADP-ribose pyrophosphatase
VPHLDDTEDIELVLVPLSEIPDLISNGAIDNAMVVLAFYWYFLRERDRTHGA